MEPGAWMVAAAIGCVLVGAAITAWLSGSAPCECDRRHEQVSREWLRRHHDGEGR